MSRLILALASAGVIRAYVGLAIGVILYATGGALRLWPVFVLGHRFSGWSR